MTRLLPPILALCAALLVPTMGHADPLSNVNGERRPLLMFSKSRSSATLDRQIGLLRDRRADLSDRDMVVLVTAGRQNTIAAIGYVRMPSNAARDLKKRFQPSETALTIVLVGKDGQENGRWNSVTDPQVIFDLIDSLPERQKELNDPSATN